MDDLQSFPTFQISWFLDGDRNGKQVVVRGNDFDKFKADVLKASEEFGVTGQQEIPATPQKPQFACSTCGAAAEFKQGVSKTGKPWKAYFCTVDKTHVSWLK